MTEIVGQGMSSARTRTRSWLKVFVMTFPCVAVYAFFGSLPAQALAPSGFQSKDGNEILQGGQDWQNIAPARWQTNQPDIFNSSKDDVFISRANSDNSNPRIGKAVIPYGSSDLSALRAASETIDNQSFLYLAWDRIKALDSANMNFEFNLNRTLRPRSSTPVRSAGDLLITFDFTRGASHVDLGVARWGSGSCQASNNISGCWSQVVDLDNSGFANGSVSGDRLFGEASVNLTAAGIYGTLGCAAFNSATLVSRSSAAFNSEVTDFTPPAKIAMSNCAEVTINAVGAPGIASSARTFALYNDQAPVGGSQGIEDTPTNPTQLCAVETAAGSCKISGIKPGSYWVAEMASQPDSEKLASQPVTVVSDSRIVLTFATTLTQ